MGGGLVCVCDIHENIDVMGSAATNLSFCWPSIQPNWDRPVSPGPYLGNLPMGGGVPTSETFNSTAYINLHALGAAALPLDRTQGGVSSTTSNNVFRYDLQEYPTRTTMRQRV